MNENVKKVLSTIVASFKSGNIPEAVALASFPIPNLPSTKWSFTNRTIMFLSGTGDGRGFNQWQDVSRRVKKGAKAFYILVPCFKNQPDESGEDKKVLCYFRLCPVFKKEDTEGKALDYENIALPDLPLLEKAASWGISVNAIPGNYRCYGYYSSKRNAICLATPEECTFFHELAHASHERVKGQLKPGQDPFQEIVAELSAQALCKLVGRQPNDTLGNTYQYIESYASKLKMSPHKACLQVLSETENVLNLILQKE